MEKHWFRKLTNIFGPEVADKSMRYAGNNFARVHRATKKQAPKNGQLHLWQPFGNFPQYRNRDETIGSIEESQWLYGA